VPGCRCCGTTSPGATTAPTARRTDGPTAGVAPHPRHGTAMLLPGKIHRGRAGSLRSTAEAGRATSAPDTTPQATRRPEAAHWGRCPTCGLTGKKEVQAPGSCSLLFGLVTCDLQRSTALADASRFQSRNQRAAGSAPKRPRPAASGSQTRPG